MFLSFLAGQVVQRWKASFGWSSAETTFLSKSPTISFRWFRRFRLDKFSTSLLFRPNLTNREQNSQTIIKKNNLFQETKSTYQPTNCPKTDQSSTRYWLRQRGLPVGSEGGLPSFAWAYSVTWLFVSDGRLKSLLLISWILWSVFQLFGFISFFFKCWGPAACVATSTVVSWDLASPDFASKKSFKVCWFFFWKVFEAFSFDLLLYLM